MDTFLSLFCLRIKNGRKKLHIKIKYFIFKKSLSLSFSFFLCFLHMLLCIYECFCPWYNSVFTKNHTFFWDTFHYISIFSYLSNLMLLEQKTLFTFRVHTLLKYYTDEKIYLNSHNKNNIFKFCDFLKILGFLDL